MSRAKLVIENIKIQRNYREKIAKPAEKILYETIRKLIPNSDPRHIHTSVNTIIGSAALTDGFDLSKFISGVEKNLVFDIESFFNSEKGNLYDFLNPEFNNSSIIDTLMNITVGGNGGMASIGRGEFFISFMSNGKAKISKSGRGDIEYKGRYEEVKHNGGKINVVEKSGKDVNKDVMNNPAIRDIYICESDYNPCRKKTKSLLTTSQRNILNGSYWEALTGEKIEPITDNELYNRMIRSAFKNVFEIEKINSILIISKNLDFYRFFDKETAIQFYSGSLEQHKKSLGQVFEIRSKQKNPISLYVGTWEF